jgi:hypothetical protein
MDTVFYIVKFIIVLLIIILIIKIYMIIADHIGKQIIKFLKRFLFKR